MGQLESGNFTHAYDAVTFRLKRSGEDHRELFPCIHTSARKSCIRNLKGQKCFSPTFVSRSYRMFDDHKKETLRNISQDGMDTSEI